MSKKEKQIKNPRMYGYLNDQEVTVKGSVLNEIMRLIEPLIEKETEVFYPREMSWYNEKGEKVENPTQEEVKSKKLVQSLDFKSIMNNIDPVVHLTPLGRELLRLQVLLFETKSNHIDEGVAKTAEEFRKEKEMKIVK